MPVTIEAAKQYQEEQAQKTASQVGGVAVNGASEAAPVAAKKKMDYKKVVVIALTIGVAAYLGYKYFIKGKGKASNNGVGLSGTYTE